MDVEALLGVLSEREREIVMLRFGLVNGRERTLEEVAALVGLTHQRVSQVLAGAMGRMRRHHRRASAATGSFRCALVPVR